MTGKPDRSSEATSKSPQSLKAKQFTGKSKIDILGKEITLLSEKGVASMQNGFLVTLGIILLIAIVYAGAYAAVLALFYSSRIVQNVVSVTGCALILSLLVTISTKRGCEAIKDILGMQT